MRVWVGETTEPTVRELPSTSVRVPWKIWVICMLVLSPLASLTLMPKPARVKVVGELVSKSTVVGVKVGALLREVMVIPLGVPLAVPPLLRTGKVPVVREELPVVIPPAVPFWLASPMVKATLLGPPSC
jgi:hypothetical protein